jgi:adenylate cyclase
VGGNAVCAALLSVVVGAIAGATAWRLIQYGILGAVTGTAVQLIAGHSFVEAALRPARVALAGDTGIGDSLPRSRPTFAAWSNVSMLAVAFAYAVVGAMLAAVFDRASEVPVFAVVIGCAGTLGFAVPLTVGAGNSPSLQPIRDLAEGTERVAAGDYSQRLPVVQDDDLGALSSSHWRSPQRSPLRHREDSGTTAVISGRPHLLVLVDLVGRRSRRPTRARRS